MTNGHDDSVRQRQRHDRQVGTEDEGLAWRRCEEQDLRRVVYMSRWYVLSFFCSHFISN
jgi:hypothetical protein